MRVYTKFLTLLLVAGLVGCASRPTEFTLDPEVYTSGINQVERKAFMLNVIAPTSKSANTESTQYLEPANDFTQAIKSSVIDSMADKGFTVSANKHFSNVVITLDFSQFEVAIHKGTVRDELEVSGQLVATVAKKQRSYRKSFNRKQTLVVALKTTDVEITGLTNEVVGHLLKSALNDDEIVTFINNS